MKYMKLQQLEMQLMSQSRQQRDSTNLTPL